MPVKRRTSKSAAPAVPQKLIVMVDGQSLNSMLHEMGDVAIDYVKFKQLIVGDRELVDFRFYQDDPGKTQGAKGFQKFLQHLGFSMNTGKPRENIDQYLVADFPGVKGHANILVLVGGDSDYYDCLKELRESGIKIEILCFSTMLSAALKEIADKVTLFEEIAEALIDPERTEKRKAKMAAIAARNGEANKPPMLQVAQLFALGRPISIATEGEEIVIRIRVG